MNENHGKKPLVAMIAFLILHAICGVVLLWLLFVMVPHYEKIFKDFGAKLAELTIAVIHVSRWIAWYWYVVVPGVCLADFAILFALYRTNRTALVMIWGIIAWLAEALLIAAILLATVVPLNLMIDTLSGGKS